MKSPFFLFAVLVCTVHAAFAQQGGIVIKDAALRNAASGQAPPLTQLDSGTPVTILERRGGWYHVSTTDQQQGWLRMLELRFVSEAEHSDASLVEILKQTGHTPTASGTTTGVRGLSNAFDTSGQQGEPVSLDQLDQFVPSSESVDQFAQDGALTTQEQVTVPDS
ncbi:MAG: SH3 domain-containing protein [Oleiphilaceae bacterium]|nr:SH3 domain-containing protein [Oleiphilaceae bacterium]